MRYLIKIAYDGSKFFGFQRLNEEQSVQKIIEDALSKIAKTNVEIKGAGRTDRGVHALAQYASFDLDVNITTDGLKDALNSLVKPYVYIREVKEVDPEFHARFDTVEKKYVYKINLGEYNPIACDYVYQVPYKLDIDKMKEVSELYLGAHNFHNFVSGERDNYDCIIYSIDFNITNDILSITFTGKSFYRYMVRNLVGAMIEVGRGKEDKEYVEKLLESSEELTCYTAPACGLYLENIKY